MVRYMGYFLDGLSLGPNNKDFNLKKLSRSVNPVHMGLILLYSTIFF